MNEKEICNKLIEQIDSYVKPFEDGISYVSKGLQKEIEAEAYLGMKYGHYNAYQRSLTRKKKKRARKARANTWKAK